MVEQEAVNFEVAGSSPAPGAIGLLRTLAVLSKPICFSGPDESRMRDSHGSVQRSLEKKALQYFLFVQAEKDVVR